VSSTSIRKTVFSGNDSRNPELKFTPFAEIRINPKTPDKNQKRTGLKTRLRRWEGKIWINPTLAHPTKTGKSIQTSKIAKPIPDCRY
jgi:hypothetical protein